MEAIFGIIIIIVFIYGFGYAISLLSTGATYAGRAVKKAVTGKETYFGPAQYEFRDESVGESGIVFKRIMFRGSIPNPEPTNVSFMISAFDATDGEEAWKPVLSLIESAQEPETICYQTTGNFGHVNTGSAFTDWVQLSAICPELIQPPYSGTRVIKVFVRMFYTNSPPSVYAGKHSDEGGTFHNRVLEFTYNFTEKGYEEEVLHREEAQAISLKIGVAVAMADGSLDDAEGEVLKQWVTREIAPYEESKQTSLKKLFNSALKESYKLARSGKLSLSPLAERLAEIGEKKAKYDAIELCLDVMAADGVADPAEMAIIRRVANVLDLDMDEIERMREKVTLTLSSQLTSEAGLESLVGVEPTWSNDQKRKHLRSEFQKWSNRLNSLPEGNERNAAQDMLNNIAELRKKYG